MGGQDFDVVIAGGGLAGSTLGGALARSGLGVLVVEKEREFRDRIRGELTWPWGYSEAFRAGLGEPLDRAGAHATPRRRFLPRRSGRRLTALGRDLARQPAGDRVRAPPPAGGLLTWAEEQGATVLRPAKVVGVIDGDPPPGIRPRGRSRDRGAGASCRGCRRKEVECAAMAARGHRDRPRAPWVRWPAVVRRGMGRHVRLGGDACGGRGWFATAADSCRVYIRLTADRVRGEGVGRTADAFVAFAADFMPAGTLDHAQQAGPMGFFPNSCTWPSHIAPGHAGVGRRRRGRFDPTQGLGTSLLFRDVRALSELLVADPDWEPATASSRDNDRPTSTRFVHTTAGPRSWTPRRDPTPTVDANSMRLRAKQTPRSAGSRPSKPAARMDWSRTKRRVGSSSASRRGIAWPVPRFVRVGHSSRLRLRSLRRSSTPWWCV